MCQFYCIITLVTFYSILFPPWTKEQGLKPLLNLNKCFEYFSFLKSQETSQSKETKVQHSMSLYQTVLYHAVMFCTKVIRCRGCQGLKGANGFREQKVPRVPGFKRCQGCRSQKLRSSTRGQGFLKKSFHIELDS